MTRVVKLKTPVKVKLGTSISFARSKGPIPICIANAADKQDCLVCFVEFRCADNFFPDLLLIPLNGLSKLGGAAPLMHSTRFYIGKVIPSVKIATQH